MERNRVRVSIVASVHHTQDANHHKLDTFLIQLYFILRTKKPQINLILI